MIKNTGFNLIFYVQIILLCIQNHIIKLLIFWLQCVVVINCDTFLVDIKIEKQNLTLFYRYFVGTFYYSLLFWYMSSLNNEELSVTVTMSELIQKENKF